MSDIAAVRFDAADHRFPGRRLLGWPLGRAFAAAAMVATGGTAGGLCGAVAALIGDPGDPDD
ncbi:MAG TPA: hypothetical protein VF414_13375 [Thermoanaerobaculia bacterium]